MYNIPLNYVFIYFDYEALFLVLDKQTPYISTL